MPLKLATHCLRLAHTAWVVHAPGAPTPHRAACASAQRGISLDGQTGRAWSFPTLDHALSYLRHVCGLRRPEGDVVLAAYDRLGDPHLADVASLLAAWRSQDPAGPPSPGCWYFLGHAAHWARQEGHLESQRTLHDLGTAWVAGWEGTHPVVKISLRTAAPAPAIGPVAPRAASNLPTAVGPWVRREQEERALQDAVDSGASLTALLGPPGSGRARLAHRIASHNLLRFTPHGGIWSVPASASGLRELLRALEARVAVLPDPPTGMRSGSMIDQINRCAVLLQALGPTLVVVTDTTEPSEAWRLAVDAWPLRAPSLQMLVATHHVPCDPMRATRLRLSGLDRPHVVAFWQTYAPDVPAQVASTWARRTDPAQAGLLPQTVVLAAQQPEAACAREPWRHSPERQVWTERIRHHHARLSPTAQRLLVQLSCSVARQPLPTVLHALPHPPTAPGQAEAELQAARLRASETLAELGWLQDPAHGTVWPGLVHVLHASPDTRVLAHATQDVLATRCCEALQPVLDQPEWHRTAEDRATLGRAVPELRAHLRTASRPGADVHRIRHTLCTALWASGEPIEAVTRLSRHRPPSATHRLEPSLHAQRLSYAAALGDTEAAEQIDGLYGESHEVLSARIQRAEAQVRALDLPAARHTLGGLRQGAQTHRDAALEQRLSVLEARILQLRGHTEAAHERLQGVLTQPASAFVGTEALLAFASLTHTARSEVATNLLFERIRASLALSADPIQTQRVRLLLQQAGLASTEHVPLDPTRTTLHDVHHALLRATQLADAQRPRSARAEALRAAAWAKKHGWKLEEVQAHHLLADIALGLQDAPSARVATSHAAALLSATHAYALTAHTHGLRAWCALAEGRAHDAIMALHDARSCLSKLDRADSLPVRLWLDLAGAGVHLLAASRCTDETEAFNHRQALQRKRAACSRPTDHDATSWAHSDRAIRRALAWLRRLEAAQQPALQPATAHAALV